MSELESKVSGFASELMETFDSVLPGSHPFRIDVGPPGDDQKITVEQEDPKGVALAVADKLRLRLLVRYRCSWNSDGRFFAVQSSAFTLKVDGVREPLLHYDYDYGAPDSVPVSHLNIHAHRDELTVALMTATRRRGRDRARDLLNGRLPRLADLHLPLGGHRFRLSVEDVLELLVQEFGIDTAPGARQALDSGRERFRIIQLSAAVTDDPETAAAELRSLGYEVHPPAVLPTRRTRLNRY